MKIQFIFCYLFHELTFSVIALSLVIPVKKVWNFKSSVFSQTKKSIFSNKPIPPKNKEVLPFWLHHHVSSTNVIIGSFALYYFSHKEFITSKEEINTPAKIHFLILTAELSMVALSHVHRWFLSQKLEQVKSSKVHQKESVLKQTEFFLFWWRHQATSINVIIDSQIVLHKYFQISKRSLSFKNKL